MPANAPKRYEMLPIDDEDHTLEIDMRWLLADKPELKEQMDGADENLDYEASTEYENPRLGSELTETQVLDLLNIGK